MPNNKNALALANGKWFEILTGLGRFDAAFFDGKHGPCPLCGDRPEADRWRWDDSDGTGGGGGYCNQCGGSGGRGGPISGMDLLMKGRGWEFKEAAVEIEKFLGETPTTAVKRNKKPARIPDKPPVDAPPPAMGRAVAQWRYETLEDEQLYWIQRYENPEKPDKRGKPSKTMVHRTWIDGKWHFPKKTDPFTSEWPSPRPMLGQSELLRRPDADVLVVEGELTRDAAMELLSYYVVVTGSNGSKAVAHVDWTPLKGRNVVLWPDADPDGVEWILRLTAILLKVGVASVSVVEPPKDAPLGWDIADAGDWSPIDARTYLEANLSDGSPPVDIEVAEVADGKPYTLLGFSGNEYYYQPGDSGQVTSISRGSHATVNLLGLAPIEHWSKEYPRFDKKTGEFIGVDWTQCVSDLFRNQHKIGCYDNTRIRGVGAWWDAGRVVFHLGDRLIVDGKRYPVLKPPVSNYIYQRLPRREGPGDAEPLSDQEGANLLSIAERFHWESKSSGILLAGWTALAPICGALDWRPHIWLNAVQGSGKTQLMNRFVNPLLSDIALILKGQESTEAGIRQTLKSNAMPVIQDEAESNNKGDASKVQGVLSLARISSSESDGITVKGSVSGEAMMFNIRSMFMLSSISVALQQGADRRRFSVLMLRIPDELSVEDKAAHWKELKTDLVKSITRETGKRLVARMVNLIPVVRESARIFSEVATIELEAAAAGDQIGALLAGAWCLSNCTPPTPEQARVMLRACELGSGEIAGRDERGGDQGDCLQTILQSRLRVEVGDRGDVRRTVGELIATVTSGGLGDPSDPVTASQAKSELGRHGIKIEGDYLLVSTTAKGLAALLRDTAWAANGWSNLLASLPGAKRWGVTRFAGLATTTRAVGIPRSLLG